jgi:hypothetical protein
MFSLEMKKHGVEMRRLIFRYAARLGRPTLLDFAASRGSHLLDQAWRTSHRQTDRDRQYSAG